MLARTAEILLLSYEIHHYEFSQIHAHRSLLDILHEAFRDKRQNPPHIVEYEHDLKAYEF